MGLIRSLALAIVLTFTFVQSVGAIWYAGNTHTGYGAKAQIFTPSSAPYMAGNIETHWVSLPSPYWIQAGWYYAQGWSNAKRYIEVNSSTGFVRNWYGDQAWGTLVEYKINHIGGSTWCAYINGGNQYCSAGLPTAPTTMEALSESQNSGNVFNTRFQGVYYRTSGGAWQLFNEANWVEDNPYWVQKDNTYRNVSIGFGHRS